MKNLLFIAIFLMSGIWSSLDAQNIIKDTSAVKKPKEGTLYYMKKDQTMYLYRNGFEKFEASSNVIEPENPIIPIDPTEPETELPNPSNPEKIKIPVGLIMWDNWVYDYWNDPNPKYDYLINHISRNRYTASYFKDKLDLVPFWGSHIAPEKIKIRYNVKWNQSLGQNTYDEIEKTVTVKYDKTEADTWREVKYYRDAGFDFLCFNYYNTDSYLSETRQHFVNMPDKLGMKMTIKCQPSRSDSEIDIITDLMTKDFWFKIDAKAVLYMNGNDFADLPKYQSKLRSKNGGEIFVVYYGFNGYPGDWNDYLNKRPQAISAYNTSIGGSGTQEEQIQKEITDRNNWINQFGHTSIKFIPILSLGIENLDNRTDMGNAMSVPLFHIDKANKDQVNRKFDLVKDFVSKNEKIVPALLWYSGTEINEGGESFVPKKLQNGKIDDSLLRLATKHLEK